MLKIKYNHNLRLCSGYQCNYSIGDKDNQEKTIIDNKTKLLKSIVKCMKKIEWDSIELLKECFKTASVILFQRLGKKIATDDNIYNYSYNGTPIEDERWAHLQLIYDLLDSALKNRKIKKSTISDTILTSNSNCFLQCLISLFGSNNELELDKVKHLVHGIYGRVKELRAVLRQYLSDYCCNYIDHNDVCIVNNSSQGICAMLEVFAAVFAGLVVPVKKQNVSLFKNAILPLHKTHHFDRFYQRLVYCCEIFVSKDITIACDILIFLLKCWPKEFPLKEKLFIQEALAIFGAYMEHAKFEQCITNNQQERNRFDDIEIKILKQFVACIKISDCIVCQEAIKSIKNTYVERLIDKHQLIVTPLINGVLDSNAIHHRNEDIRLLSKRYLEKYKTGSNVDE